jgi:nucleotide-binding universal stress UspA family protein
MYDHVLVPTDGSEQAERALDHAVELASAFDATLHVLFVVDASGFAAEVDAALLVRQLETYGQRVVDAAVERARQAGVAGVTGEVVTGSAHRRILAYADTHDVDLIVMGTHGRTGLDHFLLGSVTERVVRLADVPVLTVRGEASNGE